MQAMVVSDLAAQQQQQSSMNNVLVERTLCVTLTGTLANLALAGPQAAMWKGANGRERELFCPTMEGGADPAAMTNAIRNAVVRSLTIQEQRSTFPCTLGVSISCVRPTEVTDLGDQYAYTVLPQSVISSPQTVYSCDASLQEDADWRLKFSKWNKSNLESEGVIDVPNQPYLFVHQEHPAMGVLRFNADQLSCDMDKLPKIDGQFYKVTRQIFGECCKTLRTQVLDNLHTADMNMFSLQLHRPHAETWDDLGDGTVALQGFRVKSKWSPEDIEREKEHHLRQFVTTPYQYIARLKVVYEIPRASMPC
jgi:hypothetical protein